MQIRCNVKSIYWCDGRTTAVSPMYGCTDGSDEGLYCLNIDCPAGYWKCADNLQCIHADLVCDGELKDIPYGCKDKSDEDRELCCRGDWTCLTGTDCVPKQSVCDGIVNCNDGSDELLEMCTHWACHTEMWKCNDLKCIYQTEVCDGFTQCNDTSDEQACQNWTCAGNWWKCKDGLQCVAGETVCDGKTNCNDFSDEDDEFCMKYQCLPNYSKCANNLQCIEDSHICDENIHCLDGSDEQCDARCLKEPLGDRKAIVKNCDENSDICLPFNKFCDGVAACPDASDETQVWCSCEGWGLVDYGTVVNGLCVHEEWCLVVGKDSTGRCLTNNSDNDVNSNVTGEQY